MSVKMNVTYRSITKREKTRRRFRWWYKHASQHARMIHLTSCDGCTGCSALLKEIENYSEERGDVVR